jgi:hypothetical protein
MIPVISRKMMRLLVLPEQVVYPAMIPKHCHCLDHPAEADIMSMDRIRR